MYVCMFPHVYVSAHESCICTCVCVCTCACVHACFIRPLRACKMLRGLHLVNSEACRCDGQCITVVINRYSLFTNYTKDGQFGRCQVTSVSLTTQNTGIVNHTSTIVVVISLSLSFPLSLFLSPFSLSISL